MNHRDDQAAKIRLQQLAEPCLAVGVFNLDVLGGELAEQPVHPGDELAFQFVAVNDENDGGFAENILPLQNQARGDDHGERLARPLRVPDEAGPLGVRRRNGSRP